MLKHSYVWVSQERAGVAALKRKGSTVMIKLYFKRGKKQPTQPKKKKKANQKPSVSRGWDIIKCYSLYLGYSLCV